MPHLDADRLAALADETPTAGDAEHLAACAVCAREIEAHRRVLARAKRSADAPLDAPLTSFDAIARALRAGGDAGDGDLATARPPRWTRLRPWMQIAAALVIGAGGVFAGRASTRLGEIKLASSNAGATDVRNVSNTSNGSNPAFTTTDGKPILTLSEALKVMQRAETDYRLAAAFIASHDSSYGRGDVDRYRTRLAALDKVSDAALQAVNASPDDPVLNQYLYSAHSAREVTMRQLGNALPAGVRLTSW
jgi:hypothetical protein